MEVKFPHTQNSFSHKNIPEGDFIFSIFEELIKYKKLWECVCTDDLTTCYWQPVTETVV